MTTTIKHIGSRFYGEPNNTIENLLKLMELEKLDYSITGTFALPEGGVQLHGNFERISHSFSIYTKDWDLVQSFAIAYHNNRKLPQFPKTEVTKETKILMGLIKETA